MLLLVTAEHALGLLSRVVGLIEQQGSIPLSLSLECNGDAMRLRIELAGWSEARLTTLVARVEGLVGIRNVALQAEG